MLVKTYYLRNEFFTNYIKVQLFGKESGGP